MPAFSYRGLLVALALTSASAGSASAQERNGFAAEFRQFAEKHCLDCHGPEVQKRKLRLDKLPATFDDKDTAATWVKVLDRLARGDMPPKGEPRPPEKDVRTVLTSLQQQLHDSSLAQQQREGRVVLRRLNRTEYENTIRDLLGSTVELKDLLPDDNESAGFDKVSAVLDLSSAHLLRYQDAAEKAVRSVIPNRPQASIKERRSGREITEKMTTFRDLLGKAVRLDGDTLLMYARPWGHVPCSSAPAPVAGRYRVRASVYAIGSSN